MSLKPFPEPSRSPASLPRSLKGLLASLLLFASVMICNVLQIASFVFLPVSRQLVRKLNREIANTWWTLCDIWGADGCGIQIEITGDDLTDISDLLGGLEPAEKDCAGKTGRRWLLSYEDGGDVTGVVLDDFACGQIRVTDAPFTDAPGDVLAAPSDLLTALKLIWIES